MRICPPANHSPELTNRATVAYRTRYQRRVDGQKAMRCSSRRRGDVRRAHLSAAALFELFSAAAWTGIVAADFLQPRKLGFQSLYAVFGLRQVVASVKTLHNAVVQLQSCLQPWVGRLERRQQLPGGRGSDRPRRQRFVGLAPVVIAKPWNIPQRGDCPARRVLQLKK